MSFFDLPGIFKLSKSEKEDYLVEVIENLAKKYIRRKNALVICAMAMHNDPGLSNTMKIVKSLKASGRCVGVFTKADRLQLNGEYDALLDGKAYPLPRGYFVTKQPGPDFQHRPNMDYHAQAREEEEAFFDTDPRWTNEWKDFRSRCGTAAIQEYLSQEFANQIINSMPNVDAKIKAQRREVDKALHALPELPNRNVQHIVRAHLQEFSSGVRKLLEDGPGLLSSWSQLSNDFRDTVLAMKPDFDHTDPSDMDTPEFISIEDDSDIEQIQPPSGSKRSLNSAETPHTQHRHKARKILHDSPIPFSADQATPRTNTSARIVKQEASSDQISRSPFLSRRMLDWEGKSVFEIFSNVRKPFMTIAQIRKIIQEHELPGHPDQVPDAAKEAICMQSVQPWNGPLEALQQNTFQMLRDAILAVLDMKLGQYRQTELYRRSKKHIIEFLSQHEAQQRQQLQALYRLESHKMFTINHPAFLAYKAEELRKLHGDRRKRLVQCFVSKQAKIARRDLSAKSRADEEKKVTNDMLPRDPFRNEIDLAGYVRGYYKTAGLRFADNVCQNIQGNIFTQLHDKILGELERCLGLDEGEGMFSFQLT